MAPPLQRTIYSPLSSPDAGAAPQPGNDVGADAEEFLREALARQTRRGLLRQLPRQSGLSDFCSNDYLGFARSRRFRQLIRQWTVEGVRAGSTGSRLISGHHQFFEFLEQRIAEYHRAAAALLFNSGYDANIGLYSSVPQRHDTVVYDELVHASIRDGIRLSHAKSFSFAHNDVMQLAEKLHRLRGKQRCYVAVESVYSMDGDCAPLMELLDVCEAYGAALCVDEAHATGVFGEGGRGLVSALGVEERVFARVHTFGKALGCHGAAILGSPVLRDYLVNFARSFIYTTALPPHSLAVVSAAYDLLSESEKRIASLFRNIERFSVSLAVPVREKRIAAEAPIQSFIVPGNERARMFAAAVRAKGHDVRAVLSPTVPQGKERVRICVHSFNSERELRGLASALSEAMIDFVERV